MKITDAQRKALEAIRDGRIFWRTPWTARRAPYFSTSRADGVRADVVQRVVDARLAQVGMRLSRVESLVELTDAGREALG